jgi:hypothetical protein
MEASVGGDVEISEMRAMKRSAASIPGFSKRSPPPADRHQTLVQRLGVPAEDFSVK